MNVTIPINAGDLKCRDVEKHNRVLESGKINRMAGAASDDIRLQGTLEAKTD